MSSTPAHTDAKDTHTFKGGDGERVYVDVCVTCRKHVSEHSEADLLAYEGRPKVTGDDETAPRQGTID